MIFRLTDELIFPNPALAEPDGLLAIGGDLGKERLILAYQNGIFPWFSEGDPILWFSPHERCVIFPTRINLSKTMCKVLKSNVFKITVNAAFPEVIANCAKVPRSGQDGTWITGDMQTAYINLHIVLKFGKMETSLAAFMALKSMLFFVAKACLAWSAMHQKWH
jgi:leucyl/phenylalanyl-tRNA--protein transferase